MTAVSDSHSSPLGLGQGRRRKSPLRSADGMQPSASTLPLVSCRGFASPRACPSPFRAGFCSGFALLQHMSPPLYSLALHGAPNLCTSIVLIFLFLYLCVSFYCCVKPLLKFRIPSQHYMPEIMTFHPPLLILLVPLSLPLCYADYPVPLGHVIVV